MLGTPESNFILVSAMNGQGTYPVYSVGIIRWSADISMHERDWKAVTKTVPETLAKAGRFSWLIQIGFKTSSNRAICCILAFSSFSICCISLQPQKHSSQRATSKACSVLHSEQTLYVKQLMAWVTTIGIMLAWEALCNESG